PTFPSMSSNSAPTRGPMQRFSRGLSHESPPLAEPVSPQYRRSGNRLARLRERTPGTRARDPRPHKRRVPFCLFFGWNPGLRVSPDQTAPRLRPEDDERELKRDRALDRRLPPRCRKRPRMVRGIFLLPEEDL